MNQRERKLAELELHIDAWGRLDGERRRIDERIKRLKEGILEEMRQLKLKHANGDLYGVTAVSKDTRRVDWKSVAAKFNPSTQLVTAHTTVKHSEYPLLGAKKTIEEDAA